MRCRERDLCFWLENDQITTRTSAPGWTVLKYSSPRCAQDVRQRVDAKSLLLCLTQGYKYLLWGAGQGEGTLCWWRWFQDFDQGIDGCAGECGRVAQFRLLSIQSVTNGVTMYQMGNNKPSSRQMRSNGRIFRFATVKIRIWCNVHRSLGRMFAQCGAIY